MTRHRKKDTSQNEATPGLEHTVQQEVERQPRPEPTHKHEGEVEPAHSATDEEVLPAQYQRRKSTHSQSRRRRRTRTAWRRPGASNDPASHSSHTMPSICIPPRATGGLPTRTLSTPITQEGRGDSNRRGQKPILQHQNDSMNLETTSGEEKTRAAAAVVVGGGGRWLWWLWCGRLASMACLSMPHSSMHLIREASHLGVRLPATPPPLLRPDGRGKPWP